MEPKERKSLIQRVAYKFYDKGIEELKTYGHFQKYTPLFHFNISEPFDLNENFIYITELFGNIDQKEEDALPMILEGMRRQYQGNYNGLNRIVLQGIINPEFSNPSNALFKIENKDKIIFDDALLYLEKITKFHFPEMRNSQESGEFFKSSFNF